MVTTEPKPDEVTVLDDVIEQWRREEFAAMGFSDYSASEIAQAHSKHGGYEYDVHEVRERLKKLIENGCSPALAVRIVL